MFSWSEVVSLRMKRQYLAAPVDGEMYDQLFSDMSPVPTRYWTAPGDPPTLPAHTDFDDYDYNSRRRARRELLKGRFAGGNIAYVTTEDLPLFACLYQKEIVRFSSVQEELMKLLEHEGPMNIQLMKDLTGLLVKQITPELHKLQEAFLVYEDQLDNEGDRGWYLFEHEFPEVNLNQHSKKEALKLLLPRVAGLLVFFDEDLLKAYYRLSAKLIKETVSELVTEGVLVAAGLESKEGYLLAKDYEYLQANHLEPCEAKVILLQRNDFLVRAYSEELKKAYPSEWDSLYYLLIDGEFHGAVVGRFKFGPHILEDIILDLSEEEQERRRNEIMEAVYRVFDKEASPVQRYNSKKL